ncbi:hypothetical protein GLOTRDRAFT_131133 [Gloeophyllum trabeum ATCC 11539]|uniref:Uncharacterized protein n=1 Tax=Gloeophyllum trabeum (strain ATCC 11539 / FP-39264 / Madison 617) TaxID=670483 RepID=S7Q1F9_GLOTA|nr:uncharacterized protein GLOTRDRAFT_131133 [Gloeophyllum trabeum ATCC 11539]EPQ53801.1 hypothetical protein GLOTRDRAFT_131133 [Gloeophyllum trabeum ATCC 11539]
MSAMDHLPLEELADGLQPCLHRPGQHRSFSVPTVVRSPASLPENPIFVSDISSSVMFEQDEQPPGTGSERAGAAWDSVLANILPEVESTLEVLFLNIRHRFEFCNTAPSTLRALEDMRIYGRTKHISLVRVPRGPAFVADAVAAFLSLSHILDLQY